MRCFEIVIRKRIPLLVHQINNNMRCFEIKLDPRDDLANPINNNMRCFEITTGVLYQHIQLKINNNMRCFEIGVTQQQRL